MPSESFEERIQKKLRHSEVPPPPGLFEAIQADLQASAPAYRRGSLVGWWIVGSTLLATAAAVLILWWVWPPVVEVGEEPLAPLTQASPSRPGEPRLEPSLGAADPVKSEKQPAPADQADSPSPAPPQHEAAPTFDRPGPRTHQARLAPATVSPDSAVASALKLKVEAMDGPSEILGLKGLQVQAGQAAVVTDARSSTWWEQAPSAEEAGPPLQRWHLRLALQPEVAGRGNPARVFSPPSVDHALLERYRRSISAPSEQIHTLNYPRQHYNAKVLVGLRLGPRLSLETGLVLSMSEPGLYRRGELPVYPTSDGSTPVQEVVQQYQVQLNWQQNYLELPLRVTYPLWQKGSHRLISQLGLSLNRNFHGMGNMEAQVEAQAHTDQRDAPVYLNTDGAIVTADNEELLRLRPWYSHVSTGLMYEKKVGRKAWLSMGPSVKYMLSGAYAGEAAVDQMRYHIGVEMGLRLGQ